jgi:tetratricopeptide (TPR) repeat protein
MKMKLSFTSLLFLFSIATHAQPTENTREIIQLTSYRAYVLNTKTLWEDALKSEAAIVAKNSSDLENLLFLANLQFGASICAIAIKDDEMFSVNIKQAERNTKSVLKKNEQLPNANALLSAIYGLQISQNPISGIFLGSKATSLVDKELKLNPANPFAWLQKSMSLLNTPTAFGGDIEKSTETFQKAITLFEQTPEHLKNNWHYLEALAWCGVAYSKLNKREEAKIYWKKALGVEPQFSWVKNTLLPKLEK